jgi:hypothetical protein
VFEALKGQETFLRKRPTRDPDDSRPSSAEVNKCSYSATPSVCLHDVDN